MNRFVIKSVFAFSTATLLLGSTALSALAVTAPQQQNQDQGQGQNGGGPGGPGGGGPGGGGGGRGGFGGGPGGFGGGPGGMMGNRTISAARLSLRLMASYLSLNDTQISKIAISRDDMQEASRMNPPARGGNGGGGNGANMQSMFAEMNAKRQSAERKAVAEIKAVLSTDQTAKLATLIKAMEALQTARIRPEAVGPLKLTDEQLTRIARGGAPDTILSPDQMAIVETFRIPAGGLGGPGGPGQGGPGGPGGPDGQGGPPPPPDNSGA